MTQTLQKKYFDQNINQFPVNQTVEPLFSQQLEMEHMFQILNPLAGSTFLDFGSGTGRISIYFLSKGHNITAYDVSPNSLIKLRETYARYKTPKWGKLRTITKLNSQPKVDAVVGADVLHHVSLDRELPVINKLLKPNGKIIFSEPNPYNLFWYIHYLISHIPWSVESGILKCNKENLLKILHTYQFTNVSFAPHGLFPTRVFNRFKLLSKFNAFCLPALFPLSIFSYRYIISARKTT